MAPPPSGLSLLSWGMLALLTWSPPSPALDTLAVGMGVSNRWRNIRESSAFLNVGADSIWVWDTVPNTNLAAGSSVRGGFVRAMIQRVNTVGILVDILDDRPGLSAWIDGDPATAWGPDEDGELTRQADIILDLGAVFRANRIRLYPRLDTQHRDLILGNFEVATSEGGGGVIWALNYGTVVEFSASFPNRQPIVDLSFPSRDLRYVRLRSRETEPWELAELEVYSDGTVPVGEFTSLPLFVKGGYPLWGRVLANSRDASEWPLTIQTRVGPDAEPLQYFLKRGDDLEKVSRGTWLDFDPQDPAGQGFAVKSERGPVLPNPSWSPWQTVADGIVTSPGPQRYLQFRILLPEPGTSLKTLAFEYVGQPLAAALKAEIDPSVAEPGRETQFTLSLEVQLNQGRGDTGLRYLQVLTPAQVKRVEQVLVDDQDVTYSATYKPEGFTVDLWQRVVQSGIFVQVMFRASVFRDGTPFLVRALDRRPTEQGIEDVYQSASEADVDPLSLGGSLVVRLNKTEYPLVGRLTPHMPSFTPNGDGVNDLFEMEYGLFKLLRPAPVSFAVFDLSGRQVRQGDSATASSGQHLQIWDGRDDQGRVVPPGIYLYQIEVNAEVGVERRQGVVQVAY